MATEKPLVGTEIPQHSKPNLFIFSAQSRKAHPVKVTMKHPFICDDRQRINLIEEVA